MSCIEPCGLRVCRWLLLAVALIGGAAYASTCTLTIAYQDGAAPPYFTGEGELQPEQPGIAVEVVNLALARIGCQPRWLRLPNRRVWIELEAGRVDAALMFSYSAERAALAVYPLKDGEPDPNLRLATLSYFIYVRRGSPVRWDGQAFSGLTLPVGLNYGFSAAKDVARLGVAVEEAPGTESNLRKLQADRISAYVMQDAPADAVIERHAFTDIVKLPQPFSTKDYYLPVSRALYAAQPERVTQLWRAIAEINKLHGKALHRKYLD